MSHIWLAIKRIYNALPTLIKPVYVITIALPFEIRSLIIHALRFELGKYIKSWFVKQHRGMNRLYDWIDWVGGYPFEVARPDSVFELFYNKGFELIGLKTCGGGLGCNEFVFEKKLN